MDVFLNSPQEVKGRSPVHMRKKRYIGLLGRYGKAIRGFPGSLPGSGTQLPKIDIEIRFIVQVYYGPFW